MPAMSQTNAAAGRDEDGRLLAAVAERRDRGAFAQLVERHQQALFALAQYLASDRARAEEAVQDALLLAWNRADRFEYLGAGSVRAWLLRVTANESIRAARSREREIRRIKRAETLRPRIESGGGEAEGSAERGELLAALRAELDELSGADREMVALYYGAGLDQRSIATQMQLSQQAVSHRLKRVLETLREGLLKGGFAAALPLLDTADLGGALHGGAEVPAGFADRVAFSLARESVRSMRVAAVSGVSYAVLASLLLLGAGGAAWWQVKHRASAPAEPEPAAAASQPPVAAKKLVEEVVYVDEFDTPGLSDFWLSAHPANTRDRLSVMTKQSRLLLLFGGQSVFVNEQFEGAEHEFGLSPRVELASCFVELDERPLEILFGATEMIKAETCYMFEGAVVDDRGRFIFSWSQSRTEHGGPLKLTNKVGGEEVSVKDGPFMLSTRAYLFVDREGRVQISDGNRNFLARGKLKGSIERLRLRFNVEAFGDAEHNGFTLESLSIKRLASWPQDDRPSETQRP